MKRTIMTALLLVLLVFPAFAMEAPNRALGQKLFNSKDLGTNDKSCATCHPNGQGLAEIDAYDDGMLKEMTNFCIRDALKGKMMDLESTEINSFLIYLRSLKQ